MRNLFGKISMLVTACSVLTACATTSSTSNVQTEPPSGYSRITIKDSVPKDWRFVAYSYKDPIKCTGREVVKMSGSEVDLDVEKGKPFTLTAFYKSESEAYAEEGGSVRWYYCVLTYTWVPQRERYSIDFTANGKCVGAMSVSKGLNGKEFSADPELVSRKNLPDNGSNNGRWCEYMSHAEEDRLGIK